MYRKDWGPDISILTIKSPHNSLKDIFMFDSVYSPRSPFYSLICRMLAVTLTAVLDGLLFAARCWSVAPEAPLVQASCNRVRHPRVLRRRLWQVPGRHLQEERPGLREGRWLLLQRRLPRPRPPVSAHLGLRFVFILHFHPKSSFISIFIHIQNIFQVEYSRMRIAKNKTKKLQHIFTFVIFSRGKILAW